MRNIHFADPQSHLVGPDRPNDQLTQSLRRVSHEEALSLL